VPATRMGLSSTGFWAEAEMMPNAKPHKMPNAIRWIMVIPQK
jgi:hypothetical protein